MTADKPSKADRRRATQEKLAARRRAEDRRRRRKRLVFVAGGSLLLSALAVSLWLTTGSSDSGSTTPASESSLDRNPALLASTVRQADGKTVDGVGKSSAMEMTAYHIHSHLTVLVNGSRKVIPYGIGIVPPYSLQTAQDGKRFVSGGSGFYFLHTHDETGIIHVESPSPRQYTLGNFFHLWGQPLSSSLVGPYKGTVIVYVDGKRFTGDPASITFKNHEEIQLDIGTNAPFQPFTWPNGY